MIRLEWRKDGASQLVRYFTNILDAQLVLAKQMPADWHLMISYPRTEAEREVTS